MNIDCRDCGSDWCEKHVPVTVTTKCPGGVGHPLTWLSEGWGWCTGNMRGSVYQLWTPEEMASGPHYSSRLRFDTLAELNAWFIINVIKDEVAI